MALPAKPSGNQTDDKAARKKAAEEGAILREIDDAVRQGDIEEFGRKYGKPLFAAVIIAIAAFGGYLFWQSRQEAAMEAQGEKLIGALDHLRAGNLKTASGALASIVEEAGGGTKASAQMLRAGIAARQGDSKQAANLFAELAADESAPAALRDLAKIRTIAIRYDQMDKAKIVSELRPLAAPGKPFFGSAGELVAMAYLDQGKTAEAGALFAQIAKDEGVPESIRSRTRQMAGMLGVDAIEDVDSLLEKQGVNTDEAGAASATPSRQ